jgi:integrase
MKMISLCGPPYRCHYARPESVCVCATKTEGSKAPFTIPDVLLPALQMWKTCMPMRQPDALTSFPTENGTPMRPEGWLRRRVRPYAARLGITVPVNFQLLRRTFATNAQGYGNAKDVRTHLRHTGIATTLGVYTQPIDANVSRLVNELLPLT